MNDMPGLVGVAAVPSKGVDHEYIRLFDRFGLCSFEVHVSASHPGVGIVLITEGQRLHSLMARQPPPQPMVY